MAARYRRRQSLKTVIADKHRETATVLKTLVLEPYLWSFGGRFPFCERSPCSYGRNCGCCGAGKHLTASLSPNGGSATCALHDFRTPTQEPTRPHPPEPLQEFWDNQSEKRAIINRCAAQGISRSRGSWKPAAAP